MTTLRYKPNAQIEDLAVGECTMHSASSFPEVRWWQLWFHVLRDSDGLPDVFRVPVIPGGLFTEFGPGGRTWGLTAQGDGVWSILPSINVLDSRDAVAGTHSSPSLWHQTPQVAGVPAGEAWAVGAPP